MDDHVVGRNVLVLFGSCALSFRTRVKECHIRIVPACRKPAMSVVDRLMVLNESPRDQARLTALSLGLIGFLRDRVLPGLNGGMYAKKQSATGFAGHLVSGLSCRRVFVTAFNSF